MLAEFAHGRSQTLLKQRNMLAVFALALILLCAGRTTPALQLEGR